MAPRVLAILFADVSGSTVLYEKLGDRGALAAIESVIGELQLATSAAQGRVIKTIGDEIMAVFPDAASAARAAMDMQRRIADMPPFDGARLAIRVGFHVGPAIEEGTDVFGDTVNTAARMAGLAKAGQIITTGSAAEALPPPLLDTTRNLDAFAVKGKQDEIQVYEVLWQDNEDLTLSATRLPPPVNVEPVLKLTHAGRTIALGADALAAQIGRDAANDIVIAHRKASRLHGRVERRRDKFFYIDLSTNGTYVSIDGDAEIFLRREQVMLQGRGALAIGHSASDLRAELVRFNIE